MAFPTTSVLDDFNRANENLTTPWGGYPLGTGGSLMRVLSNQLDGGNGNTFDGSYWSTSTFGPDSEVYITIATTFSTDELFFLLARLTSPNTASPSGYGLNVNTSSGNLDFYKITSGSQSNLSSVAQSISSGDSVGFAVVGNQLQAWYKAAAGSWTQVGTQSDSTFTGAGYIGFECRTNTTPKFDNFGGGTVVAGSSFVRPKIVSGSNPAVVRASFY